MSGTLSAGERSRVISASEFFESGLPKTLCITQGKIVALISFFSSFSYHSAPHLLLLIFSFDISGYVIVVTIYELFVYPQKV